MKQRMFVIAGFIAIVLVAAACAPQPTANDTQRDRQNKLLEEGAAQVGMPAIKNFREQKLLKEIYEMRDQSDFVTYTYLWSEYQGKLVYLCDSIGYGIPYATQYSASETMQTYNVTGAQGTSGKYYGVERLPQAEPNGLFPPTSAEGTFVICKVPGSKETKTVYVEPRIVTSPFKLQ